MYLYSAGTFLLFSSLIYLAHGLGFTCNDNTVVATLNSSDTEYFNWHMTIVGEVNCTSTTLTGNSTHQTGSVSCALLVGDVIVTLYEHIVSLNNENILSSTVYCNPAQNSIFGTTLDTSNEPMEVMVDTSMMLSNTVVYTIPIEITMDILKIDGIALGEAQQVNVSLTEFSQNFTRMLVTLRISDNQNFYDIVERGCANPPEGFDVTYTVSGIPDDEAPTTVIIDFPMPSPNPIYDNANFLSPKVVKILAIAEFCPKPHFDQCFIPGDCTDGSTRLGRRKKRSTNPISVVSETIIVFPNEETRQQLVDSIIREESEKNTLYVIDENKYCFEDGLFIAIVFLLVIGALASLIILLIVFIKYRKNKLKSGSSVSGSTSSRKNLPNARQSSGSSQDGRPRDNILADDISREFVIPRVHYQRDQVYQNGGFNPVEIRE